MTNGRYLNHLKQLEREEPRSFRWYVTTIVLVLVLGLLGMISQARGQEPDKGINNDLWTRHGAPLMIVTIIEPGKRTYLYTADRLVYQHQARLLEFFDGDHYEASTLENETIVDVDGVGTVTVVDNATGSIETVVVDHVVITNTQVICAAWSEQLYPSTSTYIIINM